MTLSILISFACRLAQIKRRLPRGTLVELWWQDQARIGQQTSSPEVGPKAEPPPRRPRISVGPLYGCLVRYPPAEGNAAGIIMPKRNSVAMSKHLEDIAFHIAPGAHTVVLLDYAGWHGATDWLYLLFYPHTAGVPGTQSASTNHTTTSSIREIARRSTMANYVTRPTRVGSRVNINTRWYLS